MGDRAEKEEREDMAGFLTVLWELNTTQKKLECLLIHSDKTKSQPWSKIKHTAF